MRKNLFAHIAAIVVGSASVKLPMAADCLGTDVERADMR
jgi:hypothetical protein